LIETSSARLERRHWSIAALRAISKIQGLKTISESGAHPPQGGDECFSG
jgi:hypothetical protein